MAGQNTAPQNIIGGKTMIPDGPALTPMIPLSGMQPGRTGKGGIRGAKPSKSLSISPMVGS